MTNNSSVMSNRSVILAAVAWVLMTITALVNMITNAVSLIKGFANNIQYYYPGYIPMYILNILLAIGMIIASAALAVSCFAKLRNFLPFVGICLVILLQIAAIIPAIILPIANHGTTFFYVVFSILVSCLLIPICEIPNAVIFSGAVFKKMNPNLIDKAKKLYFLPAIPYALCLIYNVICTIVNFFLYLHYGYGFWHTVWQTIVGFLGDIWNLLPCAAILLITIWFGNIDVKNTISNLKSLFQK